MESQDEYIETLRTLQRDINCLVENDRSLKKSALNNIEKKAFAKS